MKPQRLRLQYGLNENEEKAGGLYSKTLNAVNARFAAATTVNAAPQTGSRHPVPALPACLLNVFGG